MAVVDSGMLESGGVLSVDILGRERAAQRIEGDVLYDPTNERMKV